MKMPDRIWAMPDDFDGEYDEGGGDWNTGGTGRLGPGGKFIMDPACTQYIRADIHYIEVKATCPCCNGVAEYYGPGWPTQYTVCDDDETVTYIRKDLVPRWIPVEERLPESGQRCHALALSDTLDGFPVGGHFLEGEFWEAVSGAVVTITHWMPVPKLLKEVPDENA